MRPRLGGGAGKRFRRALLVCAGWCAALLTAAEPPARRAEAIVDALARADYAAVVQTYDAAMRAALPEAKLRATWEAVAGQAGRFQERIRVQAGRQKAYDVVVVTCRMEKSAIDVRVVLNAKSELAGLFFAPARADAPAAPPAEVREETLTVGAAGWPLPATLTLPARAERTPVPAVVLVHGSGPNDRDETIGPNKPFRDLAWGLAREGIAVLRYEKRTRVHAARLAEVKDFTVEHEVVADALAAVTALRARPPVDPRRIYVAGHSLGGLLAPRIAQRDPQLAGIVVLAGPTRPLEDAFVEQTRYLLALDGSLSAEDEARLAGLTATAREVKALGTSGAIDGPPLFGIPRSYWRDLNAYDPVATAATLEQRILIVHGERDYQVERREYETWRTGLAARAKVAFRLYPQLNHLLIAGEGRSTPAEYDRPGQVDAGLIADLARWLQEPAVRDGQSRDER